MNTHIITVKEKNQIIEYVGYNVKTVGNFLSWKCINAWGSEIESFEPTAKILKVEKINREVIL